MTESALSTTTHARWVVCLCADWCGLCRDYAPVFAEAGARFPELRFVWLDIEDDEAWVGEIDVETFPTLLMADDAGVRFMGALTPHADTLDRLLQSFERGTLGLASAPEGAAELLALLRARRA